ncbi:GTP pyrophosphokinase [uncultured Ferrimonas sp.]|uniref:GTP pyrophosphokinase n=1 Tax=uncultured Ferrimonas sp. TaxID=432640 RepID=UPI002616BEEA|nr:GTP pyrophosphokinase [uncultured Ferrimonas sp.]
MRLSKASLQHAGLHRGVGQWQGMPAKQRKLQLDILRQFHSFAQSNLFQPDLPLQQLHELATDAQHELGLLLTQVAAESGASLTLPQVKSFARAEAKVATELQGEHRRLTDLARATLVGSDISGVVNAFLSLCEQADIIYLLNRFAEPKANGYRDLKVLVRLPNSGMVAEVQIHLEAIEKVKSGEEHRAYQQQQSIERQAEQEQRPLSVWEQAKISRLRRYSRALYEEAWQRYLPSSARLA